MVCVMGGKWRYSYCLVEYRFQILFKAERSILSLDQPFLKILSWLLICSPCITYVNVDDIFSWLGIATEVYELVY